MCPLVFVTRRTGPIVSVFSLTGLHFILLMGPFCFYFAEGLRSCSFLPVFTLNILSFPSLYPAATSWSSYPNFAVISYAVWGYTSLTKIFLFSLQQRIDCLPRQLDAILGAEGNSDFVHAANSPNSSRIFARLAVCASSNVANLPTWKNTRSF